MCLERLTLLRCKHYEIYRVDKDACKYKLHKKCPDFVQVVVRENKDRSCLTCTAVRNVHFGIASPSLLKLKWWCQLRLSLNVNLLEDESRRCEHVAVKKRQILSLHRSVRFDQLPSTDQLNVVDEEHDAMILSFEASKHRWLIGTAASLFNSAQQCKLWSRSIQNFFIFLCIVSHSNEPIQHQNPYSAQPTNNHMHQAHQSWSKMLIITVRAVSRMLTVLQAQWIAK